MNREPESLLGFGGDHVRSLVEEGYSERDARDVSDWVEFVIAILALDPHEYADPLRAGIEDLSRKAESLYLAVEEGKPVKMGPDDLSDRWTFDKKDNITGTFIARTGTLLLNGIDGPRATSLVLLEKLGDITEWLRDHPDNCEEIRQAVFKLVLGDEDDGQ